VPAPVVIAAAPGGIVNNFVPVPVFMPSDASDIDPGDPLMRVLPAVFQPDAPAAPPAPVAVPQPADQAFACRYVRIQNDTGENLKVFIQYRTQTDQGKWLWFPTMPAVDARDALCYDFKDGMMADLTDNDWRIHANRIRIWAVSETGKKWLDFKDADLVVVPETNDAGEPFYRAPEMQTYLFTFSR
jgi:hypothetical protein